MTNAQPAQVPVPLPPRRPIYQIAAAESRPAPPPVRSPRRAAAPVQLASLSPNEIVNMRGLWDSTAEAAATENAGRRNQCAERIERAPHSARFGRPRHHRQHRPVPDPGSRSGRCRAGLCGAGRRPSRTVGKPPIARRPSSPTGAPPRSPASRPRRSPQSRLTQAAERLDDPWLRGLVLAASVQDSLVVTQVGDPDFARLTQFMKKPGLRPC